MKRFSVKAVVIAALAIACTLALAACGSQSSTSSSANSQAKPKIVVGYATDNYGTETGQGYTDSLRYNTYIKPTLENLGWDVELKGVAYADIEKSINDGTIDCFWDNYTIQGREDKYTWSAAYMQARPILVWKNGNGTFDTKEASCDITSLALLPSGKTIGMKAGSVTYADMSAEQKAIIDSIGTLKEYPGLVQCKEAFDKGEVDMVLTEAALVAPLLVDEKNNVVMFDPVNTNDYGVAFKKGNEDKAQALGDALKNVYTSGTLKTNFEAYFKNMDAGEEELERALEQAWGDLNSDWLLKDKIIVGYASDNYGTGEGQGFTDGADYKCFIKPTLDDLGWEAEFKGIPYADIEKSINDGTIDCFWDNYTIQGREDMYAWSAAYTQARPVLLWRLENEIFGIKDDLVAITSITTLPSNAVIGVKAGSVTYADLPTDQKAIVDSIGALKEYPGLAQCKDALDKGEVNMVLTEVRLSWPLFVAHGTYGTVVFEATGSNTYGVAFKKGNEDKAQTLSDALKNVYTSGTLKTNYLAYLKNMGIDGTEAERDTTRYIEDWLLK